MFLKCRVRYRLRVGLPVGRGYMRKYALTVSSVLIGILMLGSAVSLADEGVTEFPITGVRDIVSRSAVEMDSENGNALLVNADKKTKVELFDIEGAGLGEKKLTYSARMRSEDLRATKDTRGIAYLELTVVFPDGEELVARGPRVPLSGTTDWRPADTVLYVDKGGDPQKVNLDLVVDGAGKVWIEGVRLIHRPLRTDYLFWGHVVVWIVLLIYIYHLIRKQGRLSRELRSLKDGV